MSSNSPSTPRVSLSPVTKDWRTFREEMFARAPQLTKTCTKWEIEKSITEFSPSGKEGRYRQSWCKGCFRAHAVKKHWEAPELSRQRIKESHARNSMTLRAYEKTHAAEHRVRNNRYMKKHRQKMREAILNAYGHRCVCCGETEEAFLTLEHVNGDGAAHRKLHGVNKVYADVIAEGFPDKYTLLCWNCNCAKRNGKHCPHEFQLPFRLVRGEHG